MNRDSLNSYKLVMELLKNSNGAKKSADILLVPHLSVTLHKN